MMATSRNLSLAIALPALAALHCLSGEQPLWHSVVIALTMIALQLLRGMPAAVGSKAAGKARSKIVDEDRPGAVARASGAARQLLQRASEAVASVEATARSYTVQHLVGIAAVVVATGLLRRMGALSTLHVTVIYLLCAVATRAALPAEQSAGAPCEYCKCKEPLASSSRCHYGEGFWDGLPQPTVQKEEEQEEEQQEMEEEFQQDWLLKDLHEDEAEVCTEAEAKAEASEEEAEEEEAEEVGEAEDQ
eukprot:CAMPEP_0171186698 /NCGR_PEP_ID=MMETSP0790-20130122/16946_1 /TAXON_ID=2925 /ORGANISM="Alexandrium catenella, Strain OF101" /LENGTH=247 /DNA_ID=CAMNT_0011651749 /DNA_START=33 /DNA_END=776 /DNA_ORIENTATION=+